MFARDCRIIEACVTGGDWSWTYYITHESERTPKEYDPAARHAAVNGESIEVPDAATGLSKSPGKPTAICNA